MKASKVAFLVFLCVVSLCAVTTQVKSQDSSESVYILSDGNIYSSTNATVPIQQDGDAYTFTDNLFVYTLVVQRGGITINGAGFALEGEGDIGIELRAINDVTIKNVKLNGMFQYGIYIMESSYNTITGNTIKNNGNGIVFYNSTQNTITNNIITDNNVGLDLRLTTENVFRNNNMDNTRNIAVYGTELSHYVNDMDDSNTISDDKKVYYLIGEENLVINPDTFPDVGFLALVSCTNITVQNIELSNNVQGIVLAGTTGSTIMQNSITGNDYGIMLFAASSNIVMGNSITNNNRGIQLSMFSTGNSISTNNITDNIGGMFLYNSTQNTISGNTITNNDKYGIGFSASAYNLIRGNYFIDNSIQVYDARTDDSTVTASVNTWYVSYPAGGNYWSDYTGIDVKTGIDQDENGSDGIGDTPHVIDSNNKDKYPRMLEGSSLVVYITSPENTTYNVNSVTLTYTVSETDSVIGYSLDGQANIIISGSTTLSDLTEGSHKLTVFAKDTEGNESFYTVYFTISEEAETLPITWIAAIVVVAVVGVALLYFLKIKKKPSPIKGTPT